MVQYNKIDLNLTKLQLKKIQDAVKNNNGTAIRKFVIKILIKIS